MGRVMGRAVFELLISPASEWQRQTASTNALTQHNYASIIVALGKSLD